MTGRQFLAGFVMCFAVLVWQDQDWPWYIGIGFFLIAWALYSLILNLGGES